MNCPTCGRVMLPLFTGEYCPSDCDRIPEPVIESDVTPKWFDLGEYGDILGAPGGWAKRDMCPHCGSTNVAPFDPGRTHCWPCGHVW